MLQYGEIISWSPHLFVAFSDKMRKAILQKERK